MELEENGMHGISKKDSISANGDETKVVLKKRNEFCKKLYQAPTLIPQEHLRDITLGGSPGLDESTAPDDFEPLFGPLGAESKSSKSGSGIFENNIFD